MAVDTKAKPVRLAMRAWIYIDESESHQSAGRAWRERVRLGLRRGYARSIHQYLAYNLQPTPQCRDLRLLPLLQLKRDHRQSYFVINSVQLFI